MGHSNDQHVIPTHGAPHASASSCWCKPKVDDGVPHQSGARVWIHSEETTLQLAGRASAWMAFAKGLAVMGNRDAGEHKAEFESWWLSYGLGDFERTLAEYLAEIDGSDSPRYASGAQDGGGGPA